jgi:ketosteroid isomerase-like protein
MPLSDDDFAIRDLAARYIDAVNRDDTPAWAATWSEDGTWEVLGNRAEGREQVLAMYAGARGMFSFVFMMLGSGTLEIDAPHARGRWYLTETLVRTDGTPVSVCGCYEDRYIREDGEWRFAERCYRILRQV